MARTMRVYKVPEKTYTPLENGFNLELANEVFDLISSQKTLWDQNNWRTISFAPESESSPRGAARKSAIVNMLNFEVDLKAPVCGSTMCFAGWVNELTKTDWVIDGQWMKEANLQRAEPAGLSLASARAYSEMAILPIENALDLSDRLSDRYYCDYLWESLPPAVVDHLLSRGYQRDTHFLMGTKDVAMVRLGLGNDPLRLFEATNNLEVIRAIVDRYAELGSDMGIDQIRAFYREQRVLC